MLADAFLCIWWGRVPCVRFLWMLCSGPVRFRVAVEHDSRLLPSCGEFVRRLFSSRRHCVSHLLWCSLHSSFYVRTKMSGEQVSFQLKKVWQNSHPGNKHGMTGTQFLHNSCVIMIGTNSTAPMLPLLVLKYKFLLNTHTSNECTKQRSERMYRFDSTIDAGT